jgi:hypothetical protein
MSVIRPLGDEKLLGAGVDLQGLKREARRQRCHI